MHSGRARADEGRASSVHVNQALAAASSSSSSCCLTACCCLLVPTHHGQPTKLIRALTSQPTPTNPLQVSMLYVCFGESPESLEATSKELYAELADQWVLAKARSPRPSPARCFLPLPLLLLRCIGPFSAPCLAAL